MPPIASEKAYNARRRRAMDARKHAEGGSELQRARMPNDDRARLGRMERADLPEGRFHLVDHEIDDMARPLRTERTQPPEKRLAGKRQVGTERHRARNIEARADAGI